MISQASPAPLAAQSRRASRTAERRLEQIRQLVAANVQRCAEAYQLMSQPQRATGPTSAGAPLQDVDCLDPDVR